MNGRRKILVVEDNNINRLTLCNILKPEYDVLEAANGREALEILRRESQNISLIFLDIRMPVMDGYMFLDEIRAGKTYTDIPIIVATQSDGDEDEVKALSRGATDFITKPYKPSVIRHRAANIISLRETAAIVNQMEYDNLTGIYSHAFFYRRVRQTLTQNAEKRYDIICSDVENFKFINEVFGLAVGDQILRLVAREVQQAFPGGCVAGRLRADIFGFFIEHRDGELEPLLTAAQERVREESGVTNFSIKYGVCTITDTRLPIERMCDWAMLACKSIKGQYGHTVAYYSDEMREVQMREKTLADDMEGALETGQFIVYYQPKYNLRTNRIYGAEALVRWEHPALGLMEPAEFIPIFERNGFITRLDQFVWEQAGRDMQDWRKRGLPLAPISINVSRADIFNMDIEAVLVELCSRFGLERKMLHLEITETVYTTGHEELCAVVARLRQIGFVIEMDDFGSGYSSLNMLNELPIDILKLDMKFLRGDNERVKRRGILNFVVSLARWLDLAVIAEGVETEEQVQKLRNVGCQYAQGYYFSEPLPKAEFERFLRDVDDTAEDNPLMDDEILEKTRILEVAAFQDYLTGLLNRRGLSNAVEALNLRRGGAALFVFDLDNLKECNDSNGHACGDDTLNQFSQVLRSHTRAGDILARIGGDEFLVIIPRIESVDVAQKKGEEICRAFSQIKAPGDGDAHLSCSGGLAVIEPGGSFDEAFARADRALYRAKATHKGMCLL